MEISRSPPSTRPLSPSAISQRYETFMQPHILHHADLTYTARCLPNFRGSPRYHSRQWQAHRPKGPHRIHCVQLSIPI
jgi:hypothetical protein